MNKFLDSSGLTYLWTKIKAWVQGAFVSNVSISGTKVRVTKNGSNTDLTVPYAVKSASIPFGKVDETSTETAFTATVEGITELSEGVCVYLMNGVVTSAAASSSPKCFTLDINGLGAKPVYYTTASASYATTQFNISYTMLFVYNTTRVETGCWDIFYGFDSNTNTIGYNIRTNSSTLPAKFKTYRYRLLFTSANGQYFVGANASTSTSDTTAKTPTSEKIDPFGDIVYYGATTAINQGSTFGTSYLWAQYTLSLGYSFNNAGEALTLQYPAPIFLKCSPQSDGSVIIDSTTPYVQSLPTTEDNYVYIFLGKAYSETNIELEIKHPIYYFKDGSLRQWTNQSDTDISGKQDVIDATHKLSADLVDDTSTTNKFVTSSEKTTWNDKQAALVSGTNIKTINNTSLLGSGNIAVLDEAVFIYTVDASSVVPGTATTISDSTAYTAIHAAIEDGKAVYVRWDDGWGEFYPILPYNAYVAHTSSYEFTISLITTTGQAISFDVTISPNSIRLYNGIIDVYSKPLTGIPATDLASAVQTSLGEISGKADKVLVVNHGTDDTTYTLPPNQLHIWGTVVSLTLTLATPTDATIVNEYMIEFTSGSTATTLSLPASVEWGNRDPLTGQTEPLDVQADATYQISIINNIGLWTAVSNS